MITKKQIVEKGYGLQIQHISYEYSEYVDFEDFDNLELEDIISGNYELDYSSKEEYFEVDVKNVVFIPHNNASCGQIAIVEIGRFEKLRQKHNDIDEFIKEVYNK